ncbi:MAG: hypothetical protein AAB665_01420 [Patescibacteria group bacterium]
MFGFGQLERSKLLSRVVPMLASWNVLFLLGNATGWWRPDLSTNLQFGLELVVPAVLAILYFHLAGLWWRTRRADDKEGIHADYAIGWTMLLVWGYSVYHLIFVRGVDFNQRAIVYAVLVYVILTIPFFRDLWTTWKAKHRLRTPRPRPSP